AAPETIRQIKGGTPLFDVGTHSNVSQADVETAATASTSFTHFTDNVTVGTRSYRYSMAGVNPRVPVANATSNIRSPLVPVVLNIGGHTFDPTVADSCDSGASALTRTQRSPIYNAQPWVMNGTSVGTGQLTDAYQRANF